MGAPGGSSPKCESKASSHPAGCRVGPGEEGHLLCLSQHSHRLLGPPSSSVIVREVWWHVCNINEDTYDELIRF